MRGSHPRIAFFLAVLIALLLTATRATAQEQAEPEKADQIEQSEVSETGISEPEAQLDAAQPADSSARNSETQPDAESAQGDGNETDASQGAIRQYLLPVLITLLLGVATYLLFTVRST